MVKTSLLSATSGLVALPPQLISGRLLLRRLFIYKKRKADQIGRLFLTALLCESCRKIEFESLLGRIGGPAEHGIMHQLKLETSPLRHNLGLNVLVESEIRYIFLDITDRKVAIHAN